MVLVHSQARMLISTHVLEQDQSNSTYLSLLIAIISRLKLLQHQPLSIIWHTSGSVKEDHDSSIHQNSMKLSLNYQDCYH